MADPAPTIPTPRPIFVRSGLSYTKCYIMYIVKNISHDGGEGARNEGI